MPSKRSTRSRSGATATVVQEPLRLTSRRAASSATSRRAASSATVAVSNGGEETQAGGGGDGGGGRRARGRMEDSMIADMTVYSQQNETRDSTKMIFFVIPEGQTLATCSPNLASIFRYTKDANIAAKWISEEECLQLVPMQGNVFILDPFSGPAYEHLGPYKEARQCFVLGPQVLKCLIEDPTTSNLNLAPGPFTIGMRNLLVSTSGIEQDRKEGLSRKIQMMLGEVSHRFTRAVTHIVADHTLTDKVVKANELGIPVMKTGWVDAVWETSQSSSEHATDPKFVQYYCPIFHNVEICVSQVSTSMKTALKNAIQAHGGKYSADLKRNRTSMLIVPKPEGDKFTHASSWGIPCVLPEWVEACKSAGHTVPWKAFSVEEKEEDGTVAPAAGGVKAPNGNEFISSTPKNSVVAAPEFHANHDTMLSNISGLNGAEFLSVADHNKEQVDIQIMQILQQKADIGPFLDGCQIYLSKAQTSEDVRKLVNASGATRLANINVFTNVTHVILPEDNKKMPQSEIQLLKSLESRPYFVTVEWLLESAKLKQPAEEENFKRDLEELKKGLGTSASRIQDSTIKSTGSERSQISIGDLVENGPQRSLRTSSVGEIECVRGISKQKSLRTSSVGEVEREQAIIKQKSLRTSSEGEVEREQGTSKQRSFHISSEIEVEREKGTSKLETPPAASSTPLRKGARTPGGHLVLTPGGRPVAYEEYSGFIPDWIPPQTDSFIEFKKNNPYKPLDSDSFLAWKAERPPRPEPDPAILSPIVGEEYGFTRQMSRALKKEIAQALRTPPPGPKGICLRRRNSTPVTVMMERDYNKLKGLYPDNLPSPKTPKPSKFLNISTPSHQGAGSKRGSDSSLSEDEFSMRKADGFKRPRISSDSSSEEPPEVSSTSNDFSPHDASTSNTTSEGIKETGAEDSSTEGQHTTGDQMEQIVEEPPVPVVVPVIQKTKASMQNLKNLLAHDGEMSNGGIGKPYAKPVVSSVPRLRSNPPSEEERPSAEEVDAPHVVWVNEDLPAASNASGPARRTRSRSASQQPVELVPEKKRKSPVNKELCITAPSKPEFIISGLSDSDRESVTKKSNILGVTVNSSSSFSPTAFALIANTLARSEKVLCSIAYGIPIVKSNYIDACHKAKKFLPITEEYLWKENPNQKDPENVLAKAANAWLRRIKSNDNDRPFSNERFFFLGQKRDKVDAYSRLIGAGGGEVVKDRDSCTIILSIDSSQAASSKDQQGRPIESATYLNKRIMEA